MHTQTAGYLVISGILVILLGVIGYQTHPDKAATALLGGGGFGALLMLCGILGVKRVRGGRLAALLAVALLGATCAWRASVGWLAVANGQTERTFASLLMTLVLGVSAAMLWFLLKDRKQCDAEGLAAGES